MFDTIKECISTLPDYDFHEYFTQYMMSVQDRNIDLEMQNLLSKNRLQARSMESLIHYTLERVINLDFSK